MKRYKLTIAYDGTNFAGYQKQPNQRTVQSVVEEALNKMCKTDDHIYIVGSGRTDAGVHALGQVIHFDFPHDIPARGMQRGLNSLLPLDIEIKDCQIVSDDFHARFSTHGKIYLYRISQGEFTNPFKRFYTAHYKYPIDVDNIKEALPDLIGTHDFTSFVASGSQAKSNVRTIYDARVWRDEAADEIRFEFYGNGFLYNQVRIMVAALVEIGRGQRPVHDILRLYKVKDRKECYQTAPASGLYLKQVVYDQGASKSLSDFD